METGYKDGQKGVGICKSDTATRAVDYGIEDRKGCRIYLDKHAVGASLGRTGDHTDRLIL